jgi:4-amino-4-deoxy-L-arabinose transferase-like glycosyltransferase
MPLSSWAASDTIRAMSEQNQSRRPLLIILCVFFVLALIYAWATPPLESSDELWHAGMVDQLADTWTLPVQVPGIETKWEQEGSQPPLYYTLVAALVSPIDRTDFDALRTPNPHAKAGIPGDSDNKNLVLHDTPHPPLQGTMLAVYIGRLVSIALGIMTIIAVYNTASTASRDRVAALLAAGLTAFNPMFLFITASVNNDNLVIALDSLILWQTVRMIKDGFQFRRSLLIAALLALAALAKLSGLVLIPVVALAAIYVAWKRGQWRGLVILGVLMIAAWGLLAGWWYARNVQLYGELFGTRTMVAVAGARTEPFTLETMLREFEGFRVGYWGWFGAVNITTPAAFYRVMDMLTLVALVGLALHIRHKLMERQSVVAVGLLALTIFLGAVAVIQWTAQTYASQGRLLFPFVAATSTLLALGLVDFIRLATRRVTQVTVVSIGALGLFAFAIPFATIAPQYAPPVPIESLPASAQPVYARFGEVALVGYESVDQRYEPGDYLPITVFWQVLEPSARDLSLYLHAVRDDGQVVGRIDSFPGGGRLRTTRWQAGAIYADSYRIPLGENSTGRSRLRVQIGWWHYASGQVVQPQDENGELLESVMLDAGGFVGAEQQIPSGEFITEEHPRFGGVIELEGYQLAEEHLTLLWNVTGTPDDNYTVFVQVLDANNQIIGQGDAPPELPTRYWRAGERYVTQHTITYTQPPASGDYSIYIGWYRPSDFARLDLGTADDAYRLTGLTIR